MVVAKDKPIKKFNQTKAATVIEPDREQIAGGENFILDDVIFDSKNSYKQDIAKLNGRAIADRDAEGNPTPGEPVKYWTFSSVIVEKCRNLLTGRELPVEVKVITKKSGTSGRDYFDFDSGQE